MIVRRVAHMSVQGQGWGALGNYFFGRSAGAVEILGQVRGTSCVLPVLRAVKLKTAGWLA